jgi:hypothetical protein
MRKQIKRKDKPIEMDYKQLAMQLWVDVAVAVAGSDNCTRSRLPAEWADQVVEDFWKRIDHGKARQ